MKSSPLLLKWVHYPAASYEAAEDYRGGIDAVTPVLVETAEISYFEDGEHMALLKLSSDHSARPVPYRFSITVVAAFSVDSEIAKQEYRTPYPERLPSIVAVNVARVLYGGAREYIAMMTSRATFGATVLESRLLEPGDIKISSDASPQEIMLKVFALSEEELAAAAERRALAKQSVGVAGKKVKKKRSAEKTE